MIFGHVILRSLEIRTLNIGNSLNDCPFLLARTHFPTAGQPSCPPLCYFLVSICNFLSVPECLLEAVCISNVGHSNGSLYATIFYHLKYAVPIFNSTFPLVKCQSKVKLKDHSYDIVLAHQAGHIHHTYQG